MRLLIVLFAASVLGGCLSEQKGTVGLTGGVDTTTSDTGSPADTTPSDTALTDTGDTSPIVCEVVEFDYMTYAAPAEVTPFEYHHRSDGFTVVGGRVLIESQVTDPETGNRGVGIYAYAHGADVKILTTGDASNRLLDASGTRILVARRDTAGTVYPTTDTLVVVGDSGETTIAGGLHIQGSPGISGYTGDAGRMLSDRIVAWRDCLPTADGHDCDTLRLMVSVDGGAATAVAQVARDGYLGLVGPDVQGQAVVWAERASAGEPWEIKLLEGGNTRLVATSPTLIGDRAVPRIAGSRIYWSTETDVRSALLDGSQVAELTVVREGPCRLTDVAGARVVLLCGEGGFLINGYFSVGSQVVLVDEVGVASLVEAGPGLASPRISDRWVAWLSYPTVDIGCADFENGEVRVAPVATPSVVKTLAPVGVGCLCCGAFWPVPHIDVDGDLVAWNYGDPPEEGGPGGSGLGYAVLAPDIFCPD